MAHGGGGGGVSVACSALYAFAYKFKHSPFIIIPTHTHTLTQIIIACTGISVPGLMPCHATAAADADGVNNMPPGCGACQGPHPSPRTSVLLPRAHEASAFYCIYLSVY